MIYFLGTFKLSSLLGTILWINQSSKDNKGPYNNKDGSYKVDKNKPSNMLTLPNFGPRKHSLKVLFYIATASYDFWVVDVFLRTK